MNNKKYIPPIAFLGVSLLFTLLVKYVNPLPIGPNNTTVGFASINGSIHDAIGINMGVKSISSILGLVPIALMLLLCAMAVISMIMKKSIRRVDRYLLHSISATFLLAFFYGVFEVVVINCRPIIEEGALMPEPSFPSSHTLLAVGGLGCVITCITHIFGKKKTETIIITSILYVIMIAIVATRFISGVHWFTDIIGGILYGLTVWTTYNYLVTIPIKR